jgi:hypothetical protein
MTEQQKIELALYVSNVLKYYRVDATQFVLSLWVEATKGYQLEQVISALNRHIQNPDNGQFAPKIADINKLLQGSSVDMAALAWSKVEKAIASVGHYETVVFDDPIIHAAVDRMCGWVKLSLVGDKELPFKRIEFLSVYKSIKSIVNFDYPPALSGSHDLENFSKGYAMRTPAMIGCETDCIKVFEGGSGAALKIKNEGTFNSLLSAASNATKRLSMNP